MMALAAASSSSSSSSSSPLLTEDDKAIYYGIRPEASRLPYDRLGDFSEDDLNGLKTEWNLSFENKGLLQGIWYRHPSNPINKQAAGRVEFQPPRYHSLVGGTLGESWNYQESDNLDDISSSIRCHFESWSQKKTSKNLHPLYLCLSGPGTGKSRLLQEFPNLLKHSLMNNLVMNDSVLLNRLEQAYVFNVSFENGTSYGFFDSADHEIGTRMRYLMLDLQWDQVANRYPCTIGDAIRDLATCTRKVIEDLTVIICVDGLQKLPHEPGLKNTKFYGCLAVMSQYIDDYPAFVVGVVAATTTGPVQAALADSTQIRIYLHPPLVDAFELDIFKNNPPSVAVKCMIGDMGGHGRALETLVQVLSRNGYPRLINPFSVIYNDVVSSLNMMYPDLNTISNVDDVLFASLFRSALSYDQVMDLEQKVTRHGLSRIISSANSGYYIVIPYIWIKLLTRHSSSSMLQRFAFLPEMSEPNSSNLHWQDWETFNVNVLALKSYMLAGKEASVQVQTLHSGVKWGNITTTNLIHVNQLRVQQAVHQIATADFDVHQQIQCQQGDIIVPSSGSDLIINASSAPAADSFCCRKIANGPIILESHQYKLQQQPLNQANFIPERNKAVPPSTTPSLFLLITSSDSIVSDLPPNCGLVDRSCYEAYFGPYAARAFIHNKVYANLASKKTLMSVPGIGDARATAILTHRPFSDATDCEQRTGIPGSVTEYVCFENW